MCWGVYLAIRDGEQPPDVTEESGDNSNETLGAWLEDNPWIPLAFGDGWRSWLVGHARHCSCGCVLSRNEQTIELTRPVRNYIADIADTVELIGLGIHWTGGQFCKEELPFDICGSFFSDRLRTVDPLRLLDDSFYWVAGRTPEHSGV